MLFGGPGTRMLYMVITTSPLVKTYTLQEFWDLPEPADHSKLELIKGVLYMTPPPDYPHNDASANLIQRVIEEVTRCGYLGRVFVPRAAIWVDDNTYLEPDLMYISEELQTQMDPRHWTRADIVVEVISPSNALYDRRTKADTYPAMGVRELWLVDPATKEVEVRSFETGNNVLCKTDEVLRSEVLPKLVILVTDLFS
jgi:Uma2 family endonuclease